jgi:Family of unknown function (DUF5677)
VLAGVYIQAMSTRTGFPGFEREVQKNLAPMLTAARSLSQIGQEMTIAPLSGQMEDLARQIALTVANSMESVLLLVCNGCGVDALRIARTMFEAAVTISYLYKHPELVQDYIDFLWVIRKKNYDHLLQLPAGRARRVAPERVREMLARYEQVKGRFTDKKGRIRNSWCKASLRKMAEGIEAEAMYGGIYPFGSSMTHTDVLALLAGADKSDDVEPVPSGANLSLALQKAVVSYAMTLLGLDKIANLGHGENLEAAFTRFKNASQ